MCIFLNARVTTFAEPAPPPHPRGQHSTEARAWAWAARDTVHAKLWILSERTEDQEGGMGAEGERRVASAVHK